VKLLRWTSIQFHQHFISYTQCTCSKKRCSLNVDEIGISSQFHQHFTRDNCNNFLCPKIAKTNCQHIKATQKYFWMKKLLVKCWWNWYLFILVKAGSFGVNFPVSFVVPPRRRRNQLSFLKLKWWQISWMDKCRLGKVIIWTF